MKARLIRAVVIGCGTLWGTFAYMPPVPVDRLIANTEVAIRSNPADAAGYYLLGRIYSLAFAQKIKLDDTPIEVMTWFRPDEVRAAASLEPSDIANANRSLDNYRHAVELAPENALYHYSLGWMEQQWARYSTGDWIDKALADFRAAYRLSLPNDLKYSARVLPFLSEEAGEAIIEILKQRPGNAKREIDEISSATDKMRRKPSAITPIIFSLNPNAQLADLLSSSTTAFDLDGFHDNRTWPWLQPQTCILVWDPERTGRIESGKQLFGSVTWWMFWQNGYEPLAALDDNRDGVLSGIELKGIAVWRDANGNGISDPGEVVPVEDLGIVEVAVKPREVNGVLQRENGIRLSNGTGLTTFDWTPQSEPFVTSGNRRQRAASRNSLAVQQ